VKCVWESATRMIALRIVILSSCLVLSIGAVGHANSADQSNLETAHDFYLKGNTFCHAGQYDKAIPTFVKSTELDPDYYYARINLGVALAKTGQFKKANEQFTWCIGKKWGSGSDRFVFHFNRALAAEAAGDKDLALKDRAALKRLGPLRARKGEVPRDYILMDVAYQEKRNQADRDRLLSASRASITKGKVVIRQVAKLEKNKQEYEAMALIPGTVKQVSDVLTDYASYPKFMPDVKKTTVRTSADQAKVVDHALGLPLGFVKKYRLKFHAKNGAGRTQLSWKKLPWPELKAKETVVDTYGQWIIEDFPGADGQVLAYYRIYTDPGNIPLGTGWIVDTMTTESIEDMFNAIGTRVKDLHH